MQAEILYWRGSGEVLAELIDGLERKGLKVEVVRSLDEVLDQTEEAVPFLVVVDASAGDSEASKRVVELSDARTLYNVPIVFLTHKTLKSTDVLKKQFKTFLACEIALARHGLLHQLEALISGKTPSLTLEEAPKEQAKEQAKEQFKEQFKVQPKDELKEPLLEQAPEQVLDLQPPVHEEAPRVETAAKPTAAAKVEPQRPSRPVLPPDEAGVSAGPSKKLLKNLDPAMLVSTYGGELLTAGNDMAVFDDRLLIPRHPKKDIIETALARMSNADPWLGMHARRVTYISSAVVNSLSLGQNRDLNVRTSGMLLNWGLMEERPDWLRLDLFRVQKHEHVTDIVQGFRQSADIIRERLADETAARTIAIVAAIIGCEGFDEKEDIVQDAQSILVIEAIDRACWATGSWDAFGAYRAIRHLRMKEPFALEEKINKALMRVLGEAVSAKLTLNNAFAGTPMIGDPSYTKAFQEAGRMLKDTNHFHVELSDLKPGMRLARPVVSQDGRIVLPANTEFDDDLIFRLWQLAAVRPLQSPVTVAMLAAVDKKRA